MTIASSSGVAGRRAAGRRRGRGGGGLLAVAGAASSRFFMSSFSARSALEGAGGLLRFLRALTAFASSLEASSSRRRARTAARTLWIPTSTPSCVLPVGVVELGEVVGVADVLEGEPGPQAAREVEHLLALQVLELGDQLLDVGPR